MPDRIANIYFTSDVDAEDRVRSLNESNKINLNEIRRKSAQDDGFFNVSQHSDHELDDDLVTHEEVPCRQKRCAHEAIHCMLDSWNISGKITDLLNSFLIPTCKVVGVNGFPDSLPFQQQRGLPTGAPEAAMLFLELAIWWEHRKNVWKDTIPENSSQRKP